jgi:hypothetical protein
LENPVAGSPSLLVRQAGVMTRQPIAAAKLNFLSFKKLQNCKLVDN